MGSKPVEDLIESSSGVHFSGFHLNGLQAINSEMEHPTTSVAESVHKQPFVIGTCWTYSYSFVDFVCTELKISWFQKNSYDEMIYKLLINSWSSVKFKFKLHKIKK